MDLLQDNKKKNGKTQAQKIILALLIILTIICIIIGIALVYLSTHKDSNKEYSIALNGKIIEEDMISLKIIENGTKYVSLKAISNQFDYLYYNGEFKVAEENKSKGYINNGFNIIQFFADSKEIYKTNEDSITDYEYYKLDNNILSIEENLYIALDDLDVALNLILSYSAKNNQTVILSSDYWITQNKDKLEENDITISDSSENMKALSYGYVVINKDGKYGVISLSGDELIGNKYNEITFCEYTGDFIVSNSNSKFGTISNEGIAQINMQYDSLEILNYNPLLYKVKRLNQYGIIRKDGSIVNDIIYNSIGYPENKEREINYTLIIPSLNENIPESIVVCSNDNKYGLINLETGAEVLECNLNGIYSVTDGDTIYYIVETQESKAFLENYINDLNKIIVNIN